MEGKMVALEMLVNKTVADEVTRNGLAEIALRRADAKFRAMVKCRILGNSEETKEVAQRIKSAAMQLSLQSTSNMESVRGAIRLLETGISKETTRLNTITKNIALQVDSIFQLSSVVQKMSYVNTGLAIANLAVDIAGFVVVSQKLNSLSSEVEKLAQTINNIANVQKNEKIAKYKTFIMQFNAMSDKSQSGDPIDMDGLQSLIIDMGGFITEMIADFQEGALETELVLNIIYSLIQGYTMLVKEYVTLFYSEKKRLPSNYKLFLRPYLELQGNAFSNKLQDYYFIDKRMNGRDVLDIINAQKLLALNGRVLIEDQVELIKILGTKERLEEFDKTLDGIVYEWTREIIPVVANNSGASEKECKQLLAMV